MATKTIAVSPPSRLGGGALFQFLQTLFPATFVPYQGAATVCDGVILFDAATDEAARIAASGTPVCLILAANTSQEMAAQEVRFVGEPRVQPYLQGQVIAAKIFPKFKPLICQSTDSLIATANGLPFWLERKTAGAHLVITAIEPTVLAPDAPAFPSMLKGGWIRFLPVFHFLRELTRSIDWQASGLRACFMFDDPNLHWQTWGFINYRKLLDHARKHRYHVSMASVPADMWFTHSGTAQLFKENRRHLSLLIHGVNHTHWELLRPQPRLLRLGHLARGLEIVDGLEKRYGVRVSRVMAPPHHACSIESSNLMLRLGYEAGCVSWKALLRCNPDTRWPLAFGFGQAEFLGDGFPVVPRFNFTDHDFSHLYLAALFHQPIIPIGHHYDVADGMEVLAKWARVINGLGAVSWVDLEGIVRANYLTKRAGNTLFVKMGSRKIDLHVPEGIDNLVLERAWLPADAREEIVITASDPGARILATGGQVLEPVAITGHSRLQLLSVPPAPLAQGETVSVGPGVWPLMRRFLCEGRDRIMPFGYRFKRAIGF